MKKILAIVIALVMVPLASSAEEGGFCPAMILCDESGNFYPGVDQNSYCAQLQVPMCAGRAHAAKQNHERSKRLQRYTRGYAKCLAWAKKVAQRESNRARRASERKLRSKRCGKYAERVKKLNASMR